MREDLARHCLGLDMSFHTSRTPGELIERIDGDVTALSNFFSQFSVRVFGGALMLIGILVILWLESPPRRYCPNGVHPRGFRRPVS